LYCSVEQKGDLHREHHLILPPKYLLLSIAIVEIALFDTIFVQVKVVAKGLDV
jgi:hypothetical protein